MKNVFSHLDFDVKPRFIALLILSAVFYLNILSTQGIFSAILLLVLDSILNKYKLTIRLALLLIVSTSLFFLVNENNILEIFTISSIALLHTSYKDLKKIRYKFIKIDKLDSPSSNITFYVFYLFIFTFLTQNGYINFESIDWDISSYLVSSNNISTNNLPYQNQWESKQPILYILYKMIIFLSGGSLVAFKLINDLIIFIIALMLFRLVNMELKNYNHSTLLVSLYLIFMSSPWGTAEYSEIYCLLFISAGINLLSRKSNLNNYYFLAGLMFGLSVMVNIGSLIIIIGTIFFIKNKNIFLNLSKMFVGFISPLIILTLLYYSRNLLNIFIETTFLIPLSYPSSSSFSFKILIDFFRSFFELNRLLYLVFVITFYIIFRQLKEINIKFISPALASLLFVVIALHGYYHHFIFFIFFFVYMSLVLFETEFKNLYASFLVVVIISVSINIVPKSINNLLVADTLQETYPIYNLQLELNNIIQDDYSVLALDYHLINYYLKKDNFSYVVHPTNLEEEFITDKLIKLDKIYEQEIRDLILYNSPEVIICSEDMLDFNCEVSDYDKRYVKLDYEKISSMDNIDYYKDPYKKIRVFVRKDALR
jgi:hypothetical protein